jgi:hypothetical protein
VLLAAAIAATLLTLNLLHAGETSVGPSEASINYPVALPQGYSIVSVVSGRDAVRLVSSIHWNPSRIPVVDAVVVEYGDGTRLWVARVSGSGCSVVERMASKMIMYAHQLPYTIPVPHTIDDKMVYLSLDRRSGGLHAFWCSGDLVVWVELGRGGLEVLSYIVRYYG